MITYDGEGNFVIHIMTGIEGIKTFKTLGIVDMDTDAFEKHMAKYRAIRKEEDERSREMLISILETINK